MGVKEEIPKQASTKEKKGQDEEAETTKAALFPSIHRYTHEPESGTADSDLTRENKEEPSRVYGNKPANELHLLTYRTSPPHTTHTLMISGSPTQIKRMRGAVGRWTLALASFYLCFCSLARQNKKRTCSRARHQEHDGLRDGYSTVHVFGRREKHPGEGVSFFFLLRTFGEGTV